MWAAAKNKTGVYFIAVIILQRYADAVGYNKTVFTFKFIGPLHSDIIRQGSGIRRNNEHNPQ